MATKEPVQSGQLGFVFKPKEGANAPVEAEEVLPEITEAKETTHEEVEEVLPRGGIPIISMGQLSDVMFVTFRHPDTGNIVSGKIFERYNDSQPDYGKGRYKDEEPKEFYIVVDGGSESWPVNSDGIKGLEIYETHQTPMSFAKKKVDQ